MIDDIRPPRPPKTKVAKKTAHHPPSHSRHEHRPEPEVDQPLSEIMPPIPEITIPIDEHGKSKLSKNPVKNLKNLHPKHWYNLNRTEKIMSLGGAFLIFVGAWLAIYFLIIKEGPAPISNTV